jgi:hypothetical protein
MVWRAPMDTVSHGLWKNGGKGITLFSVWEPPIMCLAWKMLEILVRFRWQEKHASQYFYLSNLSFELWHIWQISASLCEGPMYLFLCNFYFFENPSSLTKAPTRGHYCHTCALDVANIWVCFMNGSMIEHNGLGITFFSVDILKDMFDC